MRVELTDMIVLQGCPYMLLPDCSIPLIVLLAGLARLVTRAVEPQVVTGHHLLASLVIILVTVLLVITTIL